MIRYFNRAFLTVFIPFAVILGLLVFAGFKMEVRAAETAARRLTETYWKFAADSDAFSSFLLTGTVGLTADEFRRQDEKEGVRVTLIDFNGRILFDSVWLSDPVNIETGRFAEGAADEAVSEHAVPLFVPPSLLPLLDTEAHGSDTIPLVDLIRLTQAVPAESGRLAVYEREIAVRLIQAVFVLLAPFFVLQVGFRLAPETAPGGKTLVFRLPVIAAAFSLFFFAVYFITGVTAAACVLFFSPLRFIVALTVTAAAALVLFTGGFVFSFARRMFRD